MYLMNRDGFSLLAMGFTGKEAVEWKLKYIEAFNAMEQQLPAGGKAVQGTGRRRVREALEPVNEPDGGTTASGRAWRMQSA